MTLKELSECQKQTNMGAAGIAVRGLVALTLNEAEAGFLVSQPAHAGGVFWDVLQTCLFSLNSKHLKRDIRRFFPTRSASPSQSFGARPSIHCQLNDGKASSWDSFCFACRRHSLMTRCAQALISTTVKRWAELTRKSCGMQTIECCALFQRSNPQACLTRVSSFM